MNFKSDNTDIFKSIYFPFILIDIQSEQAEQRIHIIPSHIKQMETCNFFLHVDKKH